MARIVSSQFAAPAAASGLSSHAFPRGASLRKSRSFTAGPLPALPPDIAFLAAAGVTATLLRAAASDAIRLGVEPHAALLACGGVSESQYYGALAKHLGVAFDERLKTLRADFSAAAARAGVAAITGSPGAYLMAPDAPRVAALLRMAGRETLPLARITLTTPRRFAERALHDAAERLAEHASQSLGVFDPSLSAASGFSRAQSLALASGLAIAVASWCFAPPVLFVLCQMLWLAMTASVMLRLFACAAAMSVIETQSPPLRDAALPVYTVLAPVYREANSAGKLCMALERLDYPRAKLDIKILVEIDDIATRKAFEALGLPPWYQILVVPAGAPRTKPRALNIAMPFARGSLVTIYDAEDEPDPNQLRAAAARFAKAPASLACLQASLVIDNGGDSVLASLFAMEYAGLFDVVNPGMTALGLPMPLGGTSNHFRRTALERVCGWDAWNVTEDADLGLRLARFGYQVESLDVTTHEEAPARFGAWLGQRSRWQKGWMQTLATLTRNPRRLRRELGAVAATLALLQLAAGVLGPLLAPFAVALTVHDAVYGNLLSPVGVAESCMSTLWCSSALLCLISVYWPAVVGARRRGLKREAPWLALLPAYYLLMSLAAWRALYELFRNPFHWTKTSHGLARTSRRRDTGVEAPRMRASA